MSSYAVTASRTVSQSRPRSRRNARKLATPGFLFAAGLFLAVVIVEAVVIAIGAPSVHDLTALYPTVT